MQTRYNADMGLCESIHIGIDIGLKGGIATIFMLTDGEYIEVYDMPKDLLEFNDYLVSLKSYTNNIKVLLERPIAMPNQSSKATGTSFKNYGVLLGILMSNDILTGSVYSQEWMRFYKVPRGLSKPDRKQHIYELAREYFPTIVLEGNRGAIKDGRSDACMIARYSLIFFYI